MVIPTLAPTATPPRLSGKRLAILIGWGNYQHLPKLKCPLNDVSRVQQALADTEIGGFDDVVCFNKGEKADKVLAMLEETLISKVQPHDHVLIYFSGHGKLDKAGRLYLALRSTKSETLDATS